MAPNKAYADIFLNGGDIIDGQKSLTSHLASGIPGTGAGFSLVNKKYGTLPLSQLIQPAIVLAKAGFIVNDSQADHLNTYGREVLVNHPSSKAIFFKADGTPWKKGEQLIQTNLAHSLELVSRQGAEAFDKGWIADQIVKEMTQHGGFIIRADLAAYQAVGRQPVIGHYRGYVIHLVPPPSSGGIHIVQIVNIHENFDLAKVGFGSADAIHLTAEVEKYAYADR